VRPRLPLWLLWCAAAALLAAELAYGWLQVRDMQRHPPTLPTSETVYVIAHNGYAFSVLAVVASFALFYAFIEGWTESKLIRRLGLVHFTLSVVGFALIEGPGLGIDFHSWPTEQAAEAEFRLITWMSSIGFAVMLVGQIVFLAILVVVWTAPKRRAAAP
jgi:heme/copper-type cytochrome/quinol oxidase subunit 1